MNNTTDKKSNDLETEDIRLWKRLHMHRRKYNTAGEITQKTDTDSLESSAELVVA